MTEIQALYRDGDALPRGTINRRALLRAESNILIARPANAWRWAAAREAHLTTDELRCVGAHIEGRRRGPVIPHLVGNAQALEKAQALATLMSPPCK